MGAMKHYLGNMIEHLATKSGYSTEFLYDKYNTVQRESAEAGEPFDLDQFVGVTLERDW